MKNTLIGECMIDGGQACSELPDNYGGLCRIESRSGEVVAIAPDPAVAHRIACYAIDPYSGGYGPVTVTPAREGDTVTHESLGDFIGP